MKKSSIKVGKSLSMILQLGLSVLVPIFLCVWVGIKLDAYLDTRYWTILLMVLGMMAAFRNVYLMVRTFYRKDLEKEQKGHEFIKNEEAYLKQEEKRIMEKERKDAFEQWKEQRDGEDKEGFNRDKER